MKARIFALSLILAMIPLACAHQAADPEFKGPTFKGKVAKRYEDSVEW